MILGQSAATAAVLALDAKVDVQSLSYEDLKKKLLEDGQVLELERRNIVSYGVGVDPQSVSGIVVDDTNAKFTGEWVRSSSCVRLWEIVIITMEIRGKECDRSNFFQVDKKGHTKCGYPFSHGNRAGKVNYEVISAKGKMVVTLDQRKKDDGDNLWHSLGSFSFEADQEYSITVSNQDTEGFVIVDSARIIPLVLE